MLSSKGEVIWSDQPYQLDYSPGNLQIKGQVQYYKGAGTLRKAYEYASRTYFPPSGKMPDPLLFTRPQYNTWIELIYDQNQKDVLGYAKGIIANGLPPGVLMIDDNWQEDYGKWNFHQGRFPDPKQMIDELHAMGFKVMVWVCPFVSPDCDVYRDLMSKKYLVTDKTGEPAIVRWWNGASALLDLTNPDAFDWFKSQLDKLINEYGVDGFKLDAGDFEYYQNVNSFKQNATPEEHSELFGRIGLSYPLNEYRAMWKMGGQPLAERLRDKGHSFDALQLLVPNMLTAGLMGYYFSCPDMIGGGEFTAFLDDAILDQELIVRSAQCHALMPMMQFSVAPWRVLDERHFLAVKKSVEIREKYRDYILELALKAAKTGEPIMKPMEFNYPDQGYALIVDQFLLGDQLLVAPVLIKGAALRKVVIPKGRWKSFNGQIIVGPKTVDIPIGLGDLPYFELIK
ncbi:MAG: alpha-galactosidase, partial [Candidatus Marinimicrobia bacterium]|nr:alpha-galactosidase [Candidatus Neomarinimicrobiota bacterium]